MLFTDTITIFNKTTTHTQQGDVDAWTRTVVHGVQWSDHYDKQNNSGKIEVARYASITFPEGTYEGLTLDASHEEDAIFYGEILTTPTTTIGQRLSDFMEAHPKSGRIKTVNDNSNRSLLKNIKVVVA